MKVWTRLIWFRMEPSSEFCKESNKVLASVRSAVHLYHQRDNYLRKKNSAALKLLACRCDCNSETFEYYASLSLINGFLFKYWTNSSH